MFLFYGFPIWNLLRSPNGVAVVDCLLHFERSVLEANQPNQIANKQGTTNAPLFLLYRFAFKVIDVLHKRKCVCQNNNDNILTESQFKIGGTKKNLGRMRKYSIGFASSRSVNKADYSPLIN